MRVEFGGSQRILGILLELVEEALEEMQAL
jgi:hypothetical protein